MHRPWPALLLCGGLGCGQVGLEVAGKPSDDPSADDSAASSESDDTSEPGGSSDGSGGPGSSGGSGSSEGSGSSSAPDIEDPLPLELCVNEWVASNIGGLRLADGAHPDWLELHNPGEAELSLDGWSLGDREELAEALPLDASLVVPAGGELVLFADGRPELGPRHLDLSLSADGETVALFAPDGRGEVVHYGALEADFAMARASDCCRGEGCWSLVRQGTPGVGNADGGDAREVLVSWGSEWRYLDTNELPDASWTSAGFSDAAWARGAAPLGYGDTHQLTIVASGAAGARHISTWFRQEFFVAEASALVDLELDLMVDDGARVWINGVELLQVNLPAGVELTSATLASAAVGGSNEQARIRYAIDGAVLLDERNVLAVEVHQAAPTSSDMGLDAQLSALRL